MPPTTEAPTKPNLTKDSEVTPGARAEEVMDQIRTLISECYPSAQKLASAAAIRFPDSEEITGADRVLNSPTGPVGTAPPEPATDEELEWLRHPPESLRGKWVALSGREVLAAAEKLVDLVQTLRSHEPRRKTLVQKPLCAVTTVR